MSTSAREKLLVAYSYPEKAVTEVAKYRVAGAGRLGYDMEFCFVMNDSRETLTAERVKERLRREIQRFSPTFLAVHTGFAFMLFASEVVAALASIMAESPGLRLIMERVDGPTSELQRRGYIATGPDVDRIRNLLFR